MLVESGWNWNVNSSILVWKLIRDGFGIGFSFFAFIILTIWLIPLVNHDAWQVVINEDCMTSLCNSRSEEKIHPLFLELLWCLIFSIHIHMSLEFLKILTILSIWNMWMEHVKLTLIIESRRVSKYWMIHLMNFSSFQYPGFQFLKRRVHNFSSEDEFSELGPPVAGNYATQLKLATEKPEPFLVLLKYSIHYILKELSDLNVHLICSFHMQLGFLIFPCLLGKKLTISSICRRKLIH